MNDNYVILEILEQDDENVRFRIKEQGSCDYNPATGKFGGIDFYIEDHPDYHVLNNMDDSFCLRGKDKDKDLNEMTIPRKRFNVLCEAIVEFNTAHHHPEIHPINGREKQRKPKAKRETHPIVTLVQKDIDTVNDKLTKNRDEYRALMLERKVLTAMRNAGNKAVR